MSTTKKFKMFSTLFILNLFVYFLLQSIMISSEYNFLLNFEKEIPLIPPFIWVYHTLIPIIALTSIFIIKKLKLFYKCFFAYLIATLILSIFYVIFPSHYPRPVIDVHSISTFILDLTYYIDGANSTFPSSHVTFSFVMLLYAMRCDLLNNTYGKFMYCLWFMLICMSTIFLKQHYILDVVAGIFAGYLCVKITDKFYPYFEKCVDE